MLPTRPLHATGRVPRVGAFTVNARACPHERVPKNGRRGRGVRRRWERGEGCGAERGEARGVGGREEGGVVPRSQCAPASFSCDRTARGRCTSGPCTPRIAEQLMLVMPGRGNPGTLPNRQASNTLLTCKHEREIGVEQLFGLSGQNLGSVRPFGKTIGH